MSVPHAHSAQLMRARARKLRWSQRAACVAFVALSACGSKTGDEASQAGAAAGEGGAENAEKAAPAEKAEEAAGAESADNPAQAENAAPAPANTEVRAPATLDADLVRSFVALWAERWNKQDVEDWSALHAERFLAVERVGTRLLRFDRKRWMRKRVPDLRRGARWKLDAVQVSVVADVAVVQAERASTTGKLTSARAVQLVVRPAADAAGALKASDLRIARLEIVGRTPRQFALGSQPVPRDRFAFVVDAGGPWAVLGAAPERGMTGAPSLETRRSPTVGGVISASREIPLPTMPAALRRWAGREVRVLDEAGQLRCRAELGPPRGLARVIAPEQLVKTWRGERSGRASSAQIAASVWKLATGHHLLAARLTPAEGSCDRGRFVVAAGGALPTVTAPKPVDPTSKLGKAAIEALHDKAGYRLYADAFRAEVPTASGPWESAKGGSLTLHRFDAPPGSKLPSWLMARAAHGARCDAFNARFVAIWEIREGEALYPRSDDDDGGPWLVPRFAADVDGEGQPEIIGDQHLYRRTGKYVVEQESVTPVALDALCAID